MTLRPIHLSTNSFLKALHDHFERRTATGWFVKVWSFGDRVTIIVDTRKPPKHTHPLDSPRLKLADVFPK